MGLVERIAEIKKKSGFTTEELSNKSGVPLGTLNKILSGATKDPKLETVRAIAYAMNCTLDDFDDNPPIKEQLYKLSKDAQTLGIKYDKLDDRGKHTVETVVDMEYNRVHKPHLVLNATHAIEGASDEDKQHDEDIMDNF